MAREYENYRPYIAILTEKLGDREEYRLTEVATFLGVHPQTLRARKGFPWHKEGGKVFCRRLELAKYLSQ